MTNQPSASETEPVVVPKFYEFIPDILSYLADGRERSNKEIYAAVAERSALSPDQMRQLMSNGRRLVYVDRISWGLTYLKQWGPSNHRAAAVRRFRMRARSSSGSTPRVSRLKSSRRLSAALSQIPLQQPRLSPRRAT